MVPAMTPLSSFLDQTEAAVAPHGMVAGVVAVSGGSDSVALARALVLLQERGGVGPLIFAHLNHQLRGAEAEADQAFVAELTRWLADAGARVKLCCQRVNVAEIARADRENLESCARRLRYDFLVQVARAEQAAWVATGHTADDQAETVLHRLLRGTGLLGLSGIPQRRQLVSGIDLVRPLLRLSRTDVLEFLRQLQQPYQLDSTNVALDRTRNRIRHELLPMLSAEYDPAIVSILCRLAEQAREAHELLVAQAEVVLREAELPRAGEMIVLSADRLASVAPYLIREVLRLVWKRENWPLADMTFDDWDRLANLGPWESGAFDLPGGIHARRAGRVVPLKAFPRRRGGHDPL